MEDSVGPESFDGFVERGAAIEAEPLARVAMPLNVEAVGADPIEASEGRIERFCRKFFAWANARRQGSSMFTPQERRTAAPDAICPSFVTGPFGSCA